MSDHDKFIGWIKNSDLLAEQKLAIQQHLQVIQKEGELKDFQIKRQKDNLKINSRFLNKAVEDLEETVDLLKDSNRQLANFVKIASHDLKSPLRSICSFSALLNKKLSEKLDDKEAYYFKILESSAQSMSELIDDLLLFTRINSENLNIESQELAPLVSEVLSILQYDIGQNGVKLECNFEAATIKCDPIKLKQVFQNLISNSIKFSSIEGNKPHVILGLEESNDEWIFSVKDNGIGIEKEFREVIFQEFQKLNGNSFEGSGMGLSIVKEIVHKHKGRVWIEPESMEGTTIIFTISKAL